MPFLPRLPRIAVALLTLLLGLSVASCSQPKKVSDDKSPEEVLAAAAAKLNDTSGVELTLSTKDLPKGITGIVKANGVATNAPAFDGVLTVMLSGQQFEVPVIAVDDTVYARIPLTPGWSDVDPKAYGAPDPAQLINDQTGFASLIKVSEDVKEGESVRGGSNNAEVLTTFTGTVPGDAVKKVIPSSSGEEFDAQYLVNDGGELRQAVLTGVFYPDSDEMTYTVDFESYGTKQEITAP